jgi:hypothetical protein
LLRVLKRKAEVLEKVTSELLRAANELKQEPDGPKCTGEPIQLNFQNRNGYILPYQAQQLITMIEKCRDSAKFGHFTEPLIFTIEHTESTEFSKSSSLCALCSLW